MSKSIDRIRELILGKQEEVKTVETSEKEEAQEVNTSEEEQEEVTLSEEEPGQDESMLETSIEEKLAGLGLDAEMINKIIEIVGSVNEEVETPEEEMKTEMSSQKSDLEKFASELEPVFKAIFSKIEDLENEPAVKGVNYSPSTTNATSEIDLSGMKPKQRAFALINKYKN